MLWGNVAVGELGLERFGDVLAVAVGLLGGFCPIGERLDCLVEEGGGIGEQTVVRERNPCRRTISELLETRERLVEVEVRWRGRRSQHAGVGEANPDGIASEEHPGQ